MVSDKQLSVRDDFIGHFEKISLSFWALFWTSFFNETYKSLARTSPEICFKNTVSGSLEWSKSGGGNNPSKENRGRYCSLSHIGRC
jgi:hypothetical protein